MNTSSTQGLRSLQTWGANLRVFLAMPFVTSSESFRVNRLSQETKSFAIGAGLRGVPGAQVSMRLSFCFLSPSRLNSEQHVQGSARREYKFEVDCNL